MEVVSGRWHTCDMRALQGEEIDGWHTLEAKVGCVVGGSAWIQPAAISGLSVCGLHSEEASVSQVYTWSNTGTRVCCIGNQHHSYTPEE